MHRRGFVASFVGGSLLGSGCIQVDAEPEAVPIWVENQTDRQREVRVECLELGATDSLVSTDLALSRGAEESIYAKPIEEDSEYDVSIEVAGAAVTESFLADGIRDIDVEIRTTEDIRFEFIST